ncbi:MAG: hypothetical protein ABSG93_15030 [Solirubrobacteraceae bacterium]
MAATRERRVAPAEHSAPAREHPTPGREHQAPGRERPAFYALGGGRVGDAVTLLHPPYTAWHLSYFALGAAVAPTLHVNRLLWGLAAFALAVGVAAHAFDELHERPLRTSISDRTLVFVGVAGLLGALAIGVAGVLTVTSWLAPFVLVGGLLLLAYNLELAGGRFHGDAWFALGWGAFPALTGYFVNAEKLTLTGVLIAAGCLAMSVAQRRLSSAARELRRRTLALSGTRTRSDGSSEELSLGGLLGPLDGALAALSLAIVVLACALVLARL